MVAATPRRRTRWDALPEFFPYKDDGCSYHSSCLTCPFVTCRYDAAPGHSVLLDARAVNVMALLQAGKKPKQVASTLGIGLRTVFGIRQRHLKAASN